MTPTLSPERETPPEILMEIIKFQIEQTRMLADTFDVMTKILQSRDKKL